MQSTAILTGDSQLSPKLLRSFAPRNLLFTLRGAAFFLFTLYLVLGPARGQSDIVATVVGYSLLAMLLLIALVTQVVGSRIRRSLVLELSGEAFAIADSEQSDLTASSLSRMALRTSPLTIWPLQVCTIQYQFDQEALPTAIHALTGQETKERILTEDLVFPHRGNWRVKSALVTCGDALGLTSLRWTYLFPDQGIVFTVKPPPVFESTLPIISSTIRPGDELPHPQHRYGDPFDLKQYHPSDGLRRISWKIFAKRGELISRHPERTMTPEGQVICFVLANHLDDRVCSSALAYIKRLEELGLDVKLSCDSLDESHFAENSFDAEQLLIDAVWAAKDRSAEQIVADINRVVSFRSTANNDLPIERLIIFMGAGRLEKPGIKEAYITAIQKCVDQGIEPIIVAIEPTYSSKRNLHSSSLRAKVVSLLIDKTPDTAQNIEGFRNVLGVCGNRGWQVIVPTI